jgi:hypothetical protein
MDPWHCTAHLQVPYRDFNTRIETHGEIKIMQYFSSKKASWLWIDQIYFTLAGPVAYDEQIHAVAAVCTD